MAVGALFVELRFSEDVERHTTTASVSALTGESANRGPVQFDATERNILRAPVKPMGDGIYGVAWRAFSVDSHVTTGHYIFSVGNSTIQFPETVEAQDEVPTNASEGFARFVYSLGLAFCLGVPLFVLVVDPDPRATRRLLFPAATFGLLGAFGAALLFVLLGERTGLSLALLLTTVSGQSLAWRGLLLTLAAVLLLVAGFAPPRAARNLAALCLAVAAGALVAAALGSHAAATAEGRFLAVAAHAIHLLAAAVLAGAAFAFVLVARESPADAWLKLQARFMPLAAASLGLLIVTGSFAALRSVPSVSDLWTTTFGQLIVAKIALFGLLGALVYANQRRARQPAGSPKAIRRVIALEAIALVLILATAGVLSAASPPNRAVVEGSQGDAPVFELTDSTRTSHVVLGVSPNPVTVGPQRFTVQVHSLSVQPVPSETRVSIQLTQPGENDSGPRVVMTKTTPNEWLAEGVQLAREGTWKIQVHLERPDETITLDFDMLVHPEVAPSG